MFCLALVLSALVAAAPPKPVAADDLLNIVTLSDAAIAPDGMHILVRRHWMDGPNNRYRSAMAIVDAATGESKDARVQGADMAWLPDSKAFYFVQAGQIWRYDLSSEKATQITHVTAGDVSGPVPSHDGRMIAFTVSSTDPNPNGDVRIINDLVYEVNGAGYVYDSHTHIWIARPDGSDAHPLTSGSFSETGELWSYDDREVLFNSDRSNSVDFGRSDVYVISASGGSARKLSSESEQNTLQFVSQHSARLIYSYANVEDPAEYPGLRWSDFDGGNAAPILSRDTVLLGDSMLADMKEIGGPCGALSPDEQAAILNVDGPGYANLRILNLATGRLSDLTPPHGEDWSCTVSNDGKRVAYLHSDATHPVDLFVVDTDGGTPRQLTALNAAFLATRSLSQPEPLNVVDPAGVTIPAWFMPAIGGKPGERHPTIVDIHGGPATHFGDTFMHEFQYWAGRGYNVVYADPRGSTGSGYAFQATINRDFAQPMFVDIEAVMDTVVKRTDVDPARLGVLGASYGGYATLWVISHTDRYKVAIADRPVSDLASEVFGSDLASRNGLGGFYQWGRPWEAASLYDHMSPIDFVENVHTPVMIIHPENDTRATGDNAIREFSLLKILGRQAELVLIPGETHDLPRTGTPKNRIQRLRIMANWLDPVLHPDMVVSSSKS